MSNNTGADMNQDLTPQADENPFFSPNSGGDLLIEGENSSVPSVDDLESIFESVNSQSNEPEPVVDTNESEQSPLETEEPQPQTTSDYGYDDEETEKSHKAAFVVIGIIIALLLAAIGFGVVYYFKQIKPELSNIKQLKEELNKAPKEKIVVKHDTVFVEVVPEVEEPEEPVYVPQKPAEPARIATANKVPQHGWLIGYCATPDEATAIKTVAELNYVNELPCGYYWINDARPGKKMFKVYVGPYETRAEADKVFPMIKTKMADAHIFTEDENLKNKEVTEVTETKENE